MEILDDYTVVVMSSSELATAVGTGNTYNYVYLGTNIVLTSGITIDPNKASLIIDGRYPATNTEIYTLTDMNSYWPADTLGIRAASSIRLTFQNMNMSGRNYYGIPYVYEVPNTSNLQITYINVSYSGPQMTYHRNGLTQYINCDITIEQNGVSESEEVGEVNRVELGGRVRIYHNSTNSERAVFWFRGNTSTASFTVLPDADVEITSEHCYFMYSLDGALIPTTSVPVQYAIQSGASFTLNTNFGFSYADSHRAASFLVAENASFRYIQAAANGTYAALYLNGAFTAGEGSSVYMQADFANARPLINFIAGTRPTLLTVNNPRSFVLYNRSSTPVALTSPATRDFILSGGQINYWDAATSFPEAGGFEDIPDNKWFKPDWSNFNIAGNITSTQTSVTSTSLTVEEQAALPPVGNLVFLNARVISVGNLAIIPDLAGDDGSPLTGLTEPGARIIVTYTVAETDYSFGTTAGADGRFAVDPMMSIPVGTIITIRANLPFLIAMVQVTVAEAGEIIIERAPDRIAFGMPPISAEPVLLRRYNPQEPVEISDTRLVGTRWNLLVSITGPLEAVSGELLENAVVFKDEDGVLWELSNEPMAVYTGGPDAGPTDVFWPLERGILVRITEPVRSATEYSTQLIWELEIVQEP